MMIATTFQKYDPRSVWDKFSSATGETANAAETPVLQFCKQGKFCKILQKGEILQNLAKKEILNRI